MENSPRRKNIWRLFRAAVFEMVNQRRIGKSTSSQVSVSSEMDMDSLGSEPELFGILLNGNDATVYYSSKTIEDLLGYAPDSIIGVSLLDLVHPKDRSRFHRRYLHFLANIGDMAEPGEQDMEDKEEYRFLHFSRWRKAPSFQVYLSRVHCIELRKEEMAGDQADGGHGKSTTVQSFSVLLQAVKVD